MMHDETPTRPADDAGHGNSPCESAGFFERIDLLISRVVDGVATSADWAQLEEAALVDATVWRDLACAQREQALLSREVGAQAHRAERVEAPVRQGAADPRRASGRRIAAPARNPWTGWLVAAALALAAAMGWLRPAMHEPAAPVRTAGWSVDSPDEALKAYLALGQEQQRVLGELPQRVLLDSRPVQGGEQFEVVYIRRFVERARVDDLVRFTEAEDEAGRPVAVPVKVVEPLPDTVQKQSWRG